MEVQKDGIRRDTRFNGRYIVNILGGKEFNIKQQNWYSGILFASGIILISSVFGLSTLSSVGVTFILAGIIGFINTYFNYAKGDKK